jgi:hypothetical protein
MTNGELFIALTVIFCFCLIVVQIGKMQKIILAASIQEDDEIDKQVDRATAEIATHIERLEGDPAYQVRKRLLNPYSSPEAEDLEDWKLEWIECAGWDTSPLNDLEPYSEVKRKLDYFVAYELVTVSKIKNDIDILYYRWRLKKIELVGEYKKHRPGITTIARLDQELIHDLAEIRTAEARLVESRKELEVKFFESARAANPA